MRKVFIDLGAGSGDDIKGYFGLNPENITHEVFAFEANPARVNDIKDKYPNVVVYAAAAGTQDTTAKLYIGKTLNSSSLNENKKGLPKDKAIQVPVVDICRWMRTNFSIDDYITMVVDIEGGEYDLLTAMEQQDMLSWIDQLYMEFHGQKIQNFDMSIEEGLTNMLIEKFQDRVYIFRKHQHEQFLKLNNEGVS